MSKRSEKGTDMGNTDNLRKEMQEDNGNVESQEENLLLDDGDVQKDELADSEPNFGERYFVRERETVQPEAEPEREGELEEECLTERQKSVIADVFRVFYSGIHEVVKRGDNVYQCHMANGREALVTFIGNPNAAMLWVGVCDGKCYRAFAVNTCASKIEQRITEMFDEASIAPVRNAIMKWDAHCRKFRMPQTLLA